MNLKKQANKNRESVDAERQCELLQNKQKTQAANWLARQPAFATQLKYSIKQN